MDNIKERHQHWWMSRNYWWERMFRWWGDWAGYRGKKHSGALVTIVVREMSFTLSKWCNDNLTKMVTVVIMDLLKRYEYVALTIDSDNGKEFVYAWDNDRSIRCTGILCRFIWRMAAWLEWKYPRSLTATRAKKYELKKISANKIVAVISKRYDDKERIFVIKYS